MKDEAKFFSAQAVTDANSKIGQIQQKTSKEMKVETIPSLPSGASIDEEAHRRFQSERVNGILVLICTNPHRIAVRVGRKTDRVFGREQRDRLRQIFSDNFQKQAYDAGLAGAVDYADGILSGAMTVTREAERAPRGRGHSPYRREAGPSHGIGIWGILIIILIVFFAISMLRGIFGAFSGGGAGGPVAGGGFGGGGWGGGFLPGLLGGAIGSVIGNSLFNMFSGGREGYYRDESGGYADDSRQQASEWTQDDNSAGGDVGESSDLGGGDTGDSSSSDSGGDW